MLRKTIKEEKDGLSSVFSFWFHGKSCTAGIENGKCRIDPEKFQGC